MIDAGKIYLNNIGKICRGPEGQEDEKIYLPYKINQKDAVITLLDNYKPKQLQALSRINSAPKTQFFEFATVFFRLTDDDNINEEENDFKFKFIANVVQPEGFQPRGRGRLIINSKLNKTRRVIKNRTNQNTNLPEPKNIKLKK